MANNSNRKAIEFMVQGALPPHSTNVLWMDTSIPTLPVLKIFENGAWTTVHTGDSKSVELLAETVLAQQNEIAELTEDVEGKMALDATVAKEVSVKDGDDTTIGMLKSNTYGLSKIASDASDAKTAAEGIIIPTDYAKQGSDPTATNTAQMAVLNTIATNMYKGIPVVSQSENATISPNTYNVWSNVSSDLVITKGNDVSGIVNEYAMRFTLDSTWVTDTNTITFSGWQLEWNGGSVPTWTAGHTYEISIINNIALWVDIEPTV